MGYVGAFGYATTQITYSVIVASMISTLFLKDKYEIRSKDGKHSGCMVDTVGRTMDTLNVGWEGHRTRFEH